MFLAGYATEKAVVRLAVDRLTNPDIGTRLFMSGNVVKYLPVARIAKLGVANRTKLATMTNSRRGACTPPKYGPLPMIVVSSSVHR